MSTNGMIVMTWTLLVLASLPLVYACVKLWKRSKRKALMLKPKKTFYDGTFLEPSIDLEALERGL